MRLRMSALMISLVLLCGCGSAAARDREGVDLLREQTAQAAKITFLADVHADDGSAVADYVFACTRTGEATEVEVLRPELISGVVAHMALNDLTLYYDGLSFEAGALDAEGLSAIQAPSMLLSSLKDGAISQLRRETRENAETIAFRVQSTKGYEVDIWIDAQTLSPRYAEILSEGRAALQCAIRDWYTEEG